ncbi:hypothetical protein PM3016_1334 [Paenibacillus mucilaginosus 3016]|uniref:Uncharacterized protein n=1 Tax=Paenibacillus mucilaginosus 3016 TaxID=1116391 RepID=H6NC69_9BACL|nr:hypothetical protein PM3016_1334 [Paenibacillus mucilaginosus 3016]
MASPAGTNGRQLVIDAALGLTASPGRYEWQPVIEAAGGFDGQPGRNEWQPVIEAAGEISVQPGSFKASGVDTLSRAGPRQPYRQSP